MLQLFTLFSLALALVQGAALPNLQTRSDPSPLKLDFTVLKTVGNATAQEVWAQFGALSGKRDGYAETLNDFRDISYSIDVFLGSNAQKSTVSLDTGSSDLWVSSAGYNPNSSSSSKDTGEPFSIGYLDGSDTSGEFYLDQLKFDSSNPVLSSFQFACTQSAFSAGILGVADTNQESTSNKYENLPYALHTAGLTPKAAYSLYLNPDKGSGSIIFGGIDTAKYTGELIQYSIDKSAGGLAVHLPSISVNGQQINVEKGALLDSGTSLGLLPESVMEPLDQLFHTTPHYQGLIKFRFVSCDQPSDKYIDFNFGNSKISVPYSELAVDNGAGQCYFGFGSYQDYTILGDVFLRQAYVYYDLTDQTISLAQASFSSSSNLVNA